MPKLDPKDKSAGNEVIPAGDYLAALVWFQRRESKRTRIDYLSCKWLIIEEGPAKGRGFFSVLSCDLSKSGTVRRWQILAEACGVDEEFEIGDSREGTAEIGDRCFRELFLGHAMPIRVRRETGEYNGEEQVKNELQMIHYPRSWTPEQATAIAEWRQAWLRKLEEKGDPTSSGSPPDDDGYNDAPVSDDDAPPAPPGGNWDDDIPF
jgi:hypothetical protein